MKTLETIKVHYKYPLDDKIGYYFKDMKIETPFEMFMSNCLDYMYIYNNFEKIIITKNNIDIIYNVFLQFNKNVMKSDYHTSIKVMVNENDLKFLDSVSEKNENIEEILTFGNVGDYLYSLIDLDKNCNHVYYDTSKQKITGTFTVYKYKIISISYNYVCNTYYVNKQYENIYKTILDLRYCGQTDINFFKKVNLNSLNFEIEIEKDIKIEHDYDNIIMMKNTFLSIKDIDLDRVINFDLITKDFDELDQFCKILSFEKGLKI